MRNFRWWISTVATALAMATGLSRIASAQQDSTARHSPSDGFSLKTADGKFSLRFRARVQTDARLFVSDSGNTAVDNFLIRRARPILEGTLWKYLEFRIQ